MSRVRVPLVAPPFPRLPVPAGWFQQPSHGGNDPMQLTLDGRAALITGGSKGLGLAMGRAFAEAGGNVALVARGAEALAKAEAEIRATAPAARVVGIAADIATAEGCAQA